MVLWKRSSSSAISILRAIFGNDLSETNPTIANTIANVPSAMAKYFKRCPGNLPSVFGELIQQLWERREKGLMAHGALDSGNQMPLRF